MKDFEKLLHELNSFGKYQKSILLIICFASTISPVAIYVNVFISPNLDHLYSNQNKFLFFFKIFTWLHFFSCLLVVYPQTRRHLMPVKDMDVKLESMTHFINVNAGNSTKPTTNQLRLKMYVLKYIRFESDLVYTL